MFLKNTLLLTSLHLFDSKYSKSCNIMNGPILIYFNLFKITAFYLNIFQNGIYSCDFKADLF